MKCISREFINSKVLTLDIREVVKHYISGYTISGDNMMLQCPFHNDKNPSCGVVGKKGYYHCFSCHASGNVIDFVKNYLKIGYEAAIEELAKIFHLEIIYKNLTPQEVRIQSILHTLREAQDQYSSILPIQALHFLKSRGVSPEVKQLYGLGYGSKLDTSLELASLAEAGLYKVTSESDFFHCFQNRITFPIRTPKGNIIAFGARSITNTFPKYINSPETLLFLKSRVVYGIYELLQKSQDSKKLPYILLVEGYLDVLSLAKVGMHAVSCLGSQVSKVQLELIYKYTDHVIVCMDGDEAGSKANLKILKLFASLNINKKISFCAMPQGEDPDSCIIQQGAESMHKIISSASSFESFFLSLIASPTTFQSLHLAEEILKDLPNGLCRTSLIKSIADTYHIPHKELRSIFHVDKEHHGERSLPEAPSSSGKVDPMISLALSTYTGEPEEIELGMLDPSSLIECLVMQEGKKSLLYIEQYQNASLPHQRQEIEHFQNLTNTTSKRNIDLTPLGDPLEALSALLKERMPPQLDILQDILRIVPSIKENDSKKEHILCALRDQAENLIGLILGNETQLQ